MQTACNTPRTSQQPQPLPTPEEFDRLTASQFQRATAPEPSYDEMMAALDAETQQVPDLKNPAAIHLAEHGLMAKAIARENCSKYCIFDRCDGSISPRGDRHAHPVYITCHQRYCKYCGPRRMREAMENWYASHPYLRKRHNFLYFEISRDYQGIPDAEEVSWFNSDVLTFADVAEEGRIPGTGAVWNTVIRRLVDGMYRLTAKFIWWGNWDKDVYYEGCWWDTMTNVTMQVVPACSFDAALKQVFDQEIPDDPVLSAHYEMAVQDVRTAHCAGGFVRAKEGTPADSKADSKGLPDISEELFPTTDCIGNYSTKSTPNTALTTPKPHKGCKTCGAPITQRSGKVSVDITPAEIDALTWYDIQPPG